MQWADERRTLSIRTNADTPEDACKAVEFGAEGVGLVRTEYMFFNSAERIKAIRMLCVATNDEQRQNALNIVQFRDNNTSLRAGGVSGRGEIPMGSVIS